jgi:ABC-type amino acid transport substrate-binding protein
MLLSLFVSALLACPVSAQALGKCERLIATGSPDAPPYLWRDPQDPKRLMGANADLLRQAADELGVTVEFLYAGKRGQAFDEVRTGRMDLLVDAPLNVARLDVLDYVHPPIVHNDILIWARHAPTTPFAAVTDLQGHAGAISAQARLTPAFETAAAGLGLERVPSLTQAFRKLALGEVDYVLAGRYAGMVMVQTLALSADIGPLPIVVDSPGLHVALSFNSACNDSWLRGQLAKKMTESVASGRSAEVIARNLDIWKAQLLQPAEASASDK